MNVHDLFSRYLQRQTDAARDGLGFPDLGDAGPHDLAPVQPIDPKVAWDDATAAARLLGPSAAFTAPPEWAALVNQQESAVAVPLALGHYPQQVRHLSTLLGGAPLTLRRAPEAAARPDLVAWARRQSGDGPRLLAAGVLRLAGQYGVAAELLSPSAAPDWEQVRFNELGALQWQCGDVTGATAIWGHLPDGVPAAFNRGMAKLFAGDATAAGPLLRRAAEGLPESGPWHHLARLYLSLAGG